MKKLLITLSVVLLVLAVGAFAFGIGRPGDSSDEKMAAGDSSAALTDQSPVMSARDVRPDGTGKATAAVAETGPITPTMIRVGNLSLVSRHLQRDLASIKSLVATLGGQVSNESSSGSRKSSDNQYAELALRVPEPRFEQAMEQIARTARVTHREINVEDVRTQVIDIDARVKSKRASVASLERLLAQAKTVGEVMSVERELSARQADLDSLVQQQKYLSDQTSMSTINISLASPDLAVQPDREGFLGGLATGWAALSGFLVGVLTVAGVLVPWLPLLALLALAGWWLRRRTTKRPAPAL